MLALLNDVDFWLVLVSLVVTAAALGLWIRDAGDDWLRLLDTTADHPQAQASAMNIDRTRPSA